MARLAENLAEGLASPDLVAAGSSQQKRSRPAEGELSEVALLEKRRQALIEQAPQGRARVYKGGERAAVASVQAACEDDQDACHFLAYSKGGSSGAENLAPGGRLLNRAARADSFVPMAASHGHLKAATALLASAAEANVADAGSSSRALRIAKEAEAKGAAALVVAGRGWEPSSPEDRAWLLHIETAAQQDRKQRQ